MDISVNVGYFGPHISNEKNLITEHTEYWDAASQLYEKMPIIGGLMRYFRRKISYLKAY